MTARETLERLREGNRRFASGRGNMFARKEANRREGLVAGQAPSAIVLACSDSRVAPAIVLDQGLGDLFVIRVAGNVVAPELLGSVEFGAASLGARLVVVMGHSGCGAVAATLDEIENPSPDPSPNLVAIISRVRPAVEAVMASGGGADRDTVLSRGVRANVENSVRALRAESEILAGFAETDGLLIVGAEYSLETGVVDFFAGVPVD